MDKSFYAIYNGEGHTRANRSRATTSPFNYFCYYTYPTNTSIFVMMMIT